MGITIIFQGVFDSPVETYKNAVECLNNGVEKVILSAWNNTDNSQLESLLKDPRVILVKSDDPGSLLGYVEDNQKKFLNISRQKTGALQALKFARDNSYVVRLRSDAKVDAKKLLRSIELNLNWIDSNNILITDVTTIQRVYIPTNFKALHICDWVYVAKKERLESFFESFDISEEELFRCLPVPNRPGRKTPLASEQVLPFFEFAKKEKITISDLFIESGSYIENIDKYERQTFRIISLKKFGVASRKYGAIRWKYRQYPENWFQIRQYPFAFIFMIKQYMVGMCYYTASVVLEVTGLKRILRKYYLNS